VHAWQHGGSTLDNVAHTHQRVVIYSDGEQNKGGAHAGCPAGSPAGTAS